MSLDVRENFTEQGEPLIPASVCFLSVRHWAISRQSPKADFRMCLKVLLLAFRRHRVVHFFDFWDYAPRPDAQFLSCSLLVYGSRIVVVCCMDRRSTWNRKDAAATWLPKQLSCRFVASSRAIKESDWNVDGETGEIGRLILQDTVATLPVVV